MKRGVTIIGSGSYAPGAPVPNSALTRVMDTDDAWIQRRTGIEQRFFAKDGEGPADLAVGAAERAIENAGLVPKDIDYIVFCTMTPDYPFPGSGGLLGARLGIRGVPALDIRQQCAAMPFAFQVVDGLVRCQAARNVLVVGAEAHSGFMPWDNFGPLYDENAGRPDEEAYALATRHRSLAVIFGDGAGALVMRQSDQDGHGLLATSLHTDGELFDYIYIEGGGFRRHPHISHDTLKREDHIPRMRGRDLFKAAVQRLPEAVREVCKRAEVDINDVDWFVPHQANERINAAVARALNLDEKKVCSNIEKWGNTSGATIPILVDEERRAGKLKPGDLVCFVALGAGLHWGASLMRL